jgi:iron complex outermembrane recepter protein
MFVNFCGRRCASLSAIAVILVATPAFADAKTEDQPIIVVGQQDRPIEIEPRGLAVSLGEEQFAAVNAFNVEDLMKYAPNFFVRKRYSGDSNGVPGFRGTHSTQSARTLVMVDGFVVSNFLGNSFGFAPKWGVVGPSEIKQFDIVYGPYSARYAGNSMGGIINITTRDPQETEVFGTAQAFVQPYEQYGTDDNYFGYSGEAGFGWKQKEGPLSVRLTTRYFSNEGHPQSFYGLTPTTGTGTLVAGAIVDVGQTIPNSPGTSTNPIFAAQSPADITQAQAKLKIGYDDGYVIGQLLVAYWRNLDRQYEPHTYLRDANGNAVYEGRVTTLGRTFNATGANLSRTIRDEVLVGAKVAVPLGGDWNARLALSTYQIARSDGFTSNGYANGIINGAGTWADQGPTGWYTGDLTVEHESDTVDFAAGVTTNHYETDQTRFNTTNWRTGAGHAFTNQTFGKTRMLSVWTESKLPVGNNASIVAGVRYDDWRAYDGGLGRVSTNGQPVFNHYASRSEGAISPAISAQVQLANGTNMQLSLAKATRFPTVGELFQGGLNGDGTFNVNSFDPDLKPEKSSDANLLVSYDLGGVKLTGSLFYQRVSDTIFSFNGFNQNGVVTSSFKNIDKTRQYGIELIAEAKNWPVEGLDIEANAAMIDSKTLKNASQPASEGVQFPRIPRWRVNGNIRYAITDALNTSLGFRFATRPNTDLLGTQRGDTFGYSSELFALDAKVNWNINDQFRVSAGVDNITNDKAWVFHPYPQRMFLVEAGWRL